MVYNVIMAGGKGERLWPLSREKRPKQVLSIYSDKPMICETYNRVASTSKSGHIWIVTGKDHLQLIKKELPKSNKIKMLSEPMGRNTAACIGLAAILIENENPEAVMVAYPSDHFIQDTPKFKSAITEAIAQAEHFNSLVTIGIWPTFPSIGYGYLELGARIGSGYLSSSCRVYNIKRFIEKPTYETAQKYLRSGKFLWNSGIFVWRVQKILDEIKVYMPKLYAGLLRLKKHIGKPTFNKTLASVYKTLPNTSIDFGIMERSKDVFTVIGNFRWSDIGTWASLEDIFKIDKNGNVVMAPAMLTNTKNSIVFSDTKTGVIGVCGLDNIVVVKSGNEILVCKKDRSQDIKDLLFKLRKNRNFSHLT